MSRLSKFSSFIQRLRCSWPFKQPLSFLLDWRGFVLLLFLGGIYLFGPPLWDAISVSPQRRVEPLKQRIAELDKRIKASPTPSTTDLKELATLEKGRIDTEHAIRTTSVQAIAGLFVIITAWIAWKNLQATNEKQIAERFSKAVEQLGNDNIHVRLGGIYALEQIAKDNEERYYWQVLETLTSYVRERSPWPPKTPAKHSSFVESVITATERSDQETIPPLPTDIQAVMTVIARRKHHHGHHLEPDRLNLCKVDLRQLQLPPNTNLRNADLSEANLEQAVLSSINLQQANLASANLQRAYLEKSNFSGANLERADLQEAYLEQANLEDASLMLVNLCEAYLERTNLKKAKLELADLKRALLVNANLQEAILLSSELQNACLIGANLKQADLTLTKLEEARFKGHVTEHSHSFLLSFWGLQMQSKGIEWLLRKDGEAVGLTWRQVQRAASYTEELLPDYLLEQRQAASGSEGEK